ncbi:MAG: alpha/beta hydrolase [Ruminococcaceae bacterium]|nr:alpha/beta hydrolase [Oscillospiraceae bacterium]
MDLWKSLPEGYEAMPTIEYYKAENKTTDAVFVIFPGGGYSHHSEPEGAGYAKMFNVWGADAFVVKYSVAPSVFPCQLCDAKRAVQIVRANAPQYGINPEKVVVVGSSAGGHLSAMLSTFKEDVKAPENDEISKENFLPNYQVLCYPVITLSDDDIVNKGSRRHLIGENYDIDLARKLSPQLVCDEKTPPAFIWHNADDGAVHVFNSINYAKSLREHNVPVELHIFPFGGHGIAAAAEKHSGQWMGLLFNWLKEMNIY